MSSKAVNSAMVADNQLTHKRIRIRIPKDYHQEPVISRLVSDYGLIVNITAAMLGSNGIGDGWFDLDLQGTSAQIDSALTYINDLNLEIWHDIDTGSW
jgi:ABC-type methionine transport system ATPase subunit